MSIRMIRWVHSVPLGALVLLVLTWNRRLPLLVVLVVGIFLIGAVLAAVHHAEVVAHWIGEPLGSLLLAVAVTIIEVGLIISLMLSPVTESASLARDAVFATVMIAANGIVGLSVLVAALRHGVVAFNAAGSGGALATVAALISLSLVLPTFTTSTPGPTFSGAQLVFAGVVSLALYLVYVFVQNVKHRDYFLPVTVQGPSVEHAPAPKPSAALLSLGLLAASLVAVVGLADDMAPVIESGVEMIGAPQGVVGVAVALLVLLPETLAALRAAVHNRLQISLNLAFGSALASMGLTIPVVIIVSAWLPDPLLLGLGPTEMVLLAVTVAIAILTVAPGRATVLQGSVHLLVFASFLFIAVIP